MIRRAGCLFCRRLHLHQRAPLSREEPEGVCLLEDAPGTPKPLGPRTRRHVRLDRLQQEDHVTGVVSLARQQRGQRLQ